MYYIFLYHSSIEGHICCLQSLAITDNGAMNMMSNQKSLSGTKSYSGTRAPYCLCSWNIQMRVFSSDLFEGWDIQHFPKAQVLLSKIGTLLSQVIEPLGYSVQVVCADYSGGGITKT